MRFVIGMDFELLFMVKPSCLTQNDPVLLDSGKILLNWKENKLFLLVILSRHARRSYFWILFDWQYVFFLPVFETCWYFFSLLKEVVGMKWFKNMLPDRCLPFWELWWQFSVRRECFNCYLTQKSTPASAARSSSYLGYVGNIYFVQNDVYIWMITELLSRTLI